MGVHPWPIFDPASAYMTMTGGAWAAPMHAAGAALDALGAQVQATVVSCGVNDTIVGESWTGQGRVRAAASVTELNTSQADYGLQSLLKSQILHAAGELHTTTVPQMVTHIQADANRGEWGIDNAINPWVLGALTPRIIDLDTEYFGFMWPNNASAGLRYGAGLDALGAALSGLSALPAVAGGSVGAPAMAAADVASNAGMSMMSAVMSATQQAATSAISPATGAAQGAQAGSLVGQSPLSAPNTSSSTSGISPLANVTTHGPVSPSMPQSQTPAMGMFLPPSSAATLTPPAPAMPTSPPVQTMTPSAAPGVTSFAKPAEPFNPPPPSGGKAVGLKPGMLNASALRGPVGTAPASTALLTKPLTTTSSLATQPLAYVAPQQPLPPAPATPPQPPLLSPGDTAQSLAPPPQPQQAPQSPPHTPPQPPQQQSPPQPQQQPPARPQPNPNVGDAPNQGVHNLIGDLKDSPGAQALSVHNAQDVHDIIDKLPPGESPGVHELPTPEAIRGLFGQLTENAGPAPPSTYPGEERMLPDGTRISFRTDSKSGGETVDVRYPDGSKDKVHLPREKKPTPEPAPQPAPEPHPVQVPATQAPQTHEPVHDDPGHQIHVDPPPPGFWATVGAIVLGGLAALGKLAQAAE
jgi:hypothetical protein